MPKHKQKHKPKQKRSAPPPPQVQRDDERCAHPGCNERVADSLPPPSAAPPASAPPTSALPKVPILVHRYPSPAHSCPTVDAPAESSSSQPINPEQNGQSATATAATANTAPPTVGETSPERLSLSPLNPRPTHSMVYAYCPSCTMKGAAYASPIPFLHPSRYFPRHQLFATNEGDGILYELSGLMKAAPDLNDRLYPPHIRRLATASGGSSTLAIMRNQIERSRAEGLRILADVACGLEADENGKKRRDVKSGGMKSGRMKSGDMTDNHIEYLKKLKGEEEDHPLKTPPPCGFCNRRVMRFSDLEFQKDTSLAYKNQNDGAGIELYDHQPSEKLRHTWTTKAPAGAPRNWIEIDSDECEEMNRMLLMRQDGDTRQLPTQLRTPIPTPTTPKFRIPKIPRQSPKLNDDLFPGFKEAMASPAFPPIDDSMFIDYLKSAAREGKGMVIDREKDEVFLAYIQALAQSGISPSDTEFKGAYEDTKDAYAKTMADRTTSERKLRIAKSKAFHDHVAAGKSGTGVGMSASGMGTGLRSDNPFVNLPSGLTPYPCPGTYRYTPPGTPAVPDMSFGGSGLSVAGPRSSGPSMAGSSVSGPGMNSSGPANTNPNTNTATSTSPWKPKSTSHSKSKGKSGMGVAGMSVADFLSTADPTAQRMAGSSMSAPSIRISAPPKTTTGISTSPSKSTSTSPSKSPPKPTKRRPPPLTLTPLLPSFINSALTLEASLLKKFPSLHPTTIITAVRAQAGVAFRQGRILDTKVYGKDGKAVQKKIEEGMEKEREKLEAKIERMVRERQKMVKLKRELRGNLNPGGGLWGEGLSVDEIAAVAVNLWERGSGKGK